MTVPSKLENLAGACAGFLRCGSVSLDARSLLQSAAVLFIAAGVYITLALFSERLSFGSDRDDFLVAYSAERLALQHVYEPSRLPGTPVLERAVSFLVTSYRDARPAKLFIAFCSTAMVGLLLLCGYMAGGDRRIVPLAGLLFAAVPVWVQVSFMVMDYSLALLLVTFAAFLLSYCPTSKTSGAIVLSLVAGFSLALGIGSRFTAVLFLPAAAIVIVFDSRVSGRLRGAVLAGVALSASLSLLWYKPTIDLYGIKFLSCWPAHLALPGLLRAEIDAIIGLAGGAAGTAIAALLLFLVFKNLKGRLFSSIWERQGWGVRIILLYSLFNTLFYIVLPNKVTYYLPLLPGCILLFMIGLRPGRRRIIAVAVAVVVVSSFVRVGISRRHVLSFEAGQAALEWKQQGRDRQLYEKTRTLVADSSRQVLCLGYPATDRMLVWFFDKVKTAEVLTHPNCRTMWGTPTIYPEPVYLINNILATDQPHFLSEHNTARIEAILTERNIERITAISSPRGEPVLIPEKLCRGRTCEKLKY
ncbi:MAG: hypothetical protein JW699_06060 [Chitinispirillaceae bacterium]|nr:hypothetical protein [Chitinispirillaceae bacterium]